MTLGDFSRAYNYAGQKGPIPIFNVGHNNLGISLTFRNNITKKCSVLGISMIRSAHGDDNDGNENTEYINPSLLANFDKRWDEVVALGRFVKAEEFRKT